MASAAHLAETTPTVDTTPTPDTTDPTTTDNRRVIGPVTSAAAGGAAFTAIACWALSLAGVHVPQDIQADITVMVVLLAGWAVKPAGNRA